VVGIVCKGMSSDELRDGLMKGLHQYATGIGRRRYRPAPALLQSGPASRPIQKTRPCSIAMSKRLDEVARPRKLAATGCFIHTPSTAFLLDQLRTRPHRPLAENGGARAAGDRKAVCTDLASAKALNSELPAGRGHQTYLDRSLPSASVPSRTSWCCAYNGMFGADLELKPHRPHPDHGRRKNSRRPSRQFR
jgi:hypothetical protein